MSKIDFEKELISNYMGYEKVEIGYCGSHDETKWQVDNAKWMDDNGLDSIGTYIVNIEDNKWYNWDEVSYHSSWDWLMSVILKIESMDYGFKICRKVVEVYIDSTKETIIKSKESNKMKSVFKAVFEFIEWYNLKKQNEVN